MKLIYRLGRILHLNKISLFKHFFYKILRWKIPIPLPIQGMFLSNFPLQFFILGAHEIETTEYIKRNITKDHIFIDVGANMGYYTVLGAKQAGYVYAFEPSPRNFVQLKKNIALNKADNVACFEVALSRVEETRFFNVLEGGSGVDGFYTGKSNMQGIKVQTRTLDSFNIGTADFMKIDVEGAEMEVLGGSVQLVEKNPHIKIILEFSPKNIHVAGESPQSFLKQLKMKGFMYRAIEVGGQVVRREDNELCSLKKINLLLERQ